MTTPATNANIATPSEQLAVYDPTGHQYNVLIQGDTVLQDATTGVYYTPLLQKNAGNVDTVTLLASAAQTTTQTIDNIVQIGARGVVICVDTTVNAVACSNVVTIYGKDPVSGKSNLLLTGAAITGVGTVFYTIYPGATVAANLTVSLPLPRTYKVVVTAGNANSATYSVAASYIV